MKGETFDWCSLHEWIILVWQSPCPSLIFPEKVLFFAHTTSNIKPWRAPTLFITAYDKQIDDVVSFMQPIACKSVEAMRVSIEVYLTYLQKRDVYKVCVSDFYVKYWNLSIPSSMTYFLEAWKAHYKQFKVRKTSIFPLCTACEQFLSCLTSWARTQLNTTGIFQTNVFQSWNVCFWTPLISKGKNDIRHSPTRVACSKVDGADPSTFGFSQFPPWRRMCKDVR